MTLAETAALGLLAVAGYMLVLWVASLALRNASIVDIFWGAGFALLSWLYAAAGDGFETRRLLVAALVSAWGLRLSAYILWRNAGKGEDYRYRKWREEAGERFWWVSLFQVFLLQGALLWLISAPILAATHFDSPGQLTILDAAGIAVWGVGVFFEAVGDWQLARFKSDPSNKGKVMRSGLWQYTRHPNYFGDATVWWGLFLVGAATGWGALAVFSPAAMTVLLLRVSGVALLEKAQVQTKPGYQDYIETTSAFFPLPPRRRRRPA